MKIVDLSHPLRNGSPAYPGDPLFAIEPWATLEKEGYRVSRIVTGTHQGTHLDGLSHFLEDGPSVDAMPLDWFYGPATVLHLPKAAGDTITVDDLQPYERAFVPDGKVLIQTGWGNRYGCGDFYTSHPAFDPNSCRWIVSHGIRLLGMDMPSPSIEATTAHGILLGAGVVVVESLANLDQLPPSVIFAAFPLKLIGGDGSPVRAVAIVG